MKTIEEPLFKSYVFVKMGDEDTYNVRMTDGVVNFVYWNGKPAIIKEKEIQTIKRFLDEYENVEVVKIELAAGDKGTGDSRSHDGSGRKSAGSEK